MHIILSILVRERRGRFERYPEKTVKDGGMVWSDVVTRQGILVATRSRKRQGADRFFYRASGGNTVLLTPSFQPSETDFGLLISKIVRE